jgi:hypothetical protein
MTDAALPPNDRYAHLRANAAAQRQATVDRLKQAISQLQADQRPVNTFTIKEVSGMDYMTYYRNPEALALFRTHSTHLRQDREKEQAKRHQFKRKRARRDEAFPQVPVQPRDPLLNYKKPELVARLRAARAECDQLKQQGGAERTKETQRYTTLLQEHMQCGVTIAKLEAQLAQYLAFMERFRSSLRHEEYGQKE